LRAAAKTDRCVLLLLADMHSRPLHMMVPLDLMLTSAGRRTKRLLLRLRRTVLVFAQGFELEDAIHTIPPLSCPLLTSEVHWMA
jgi:hypothetical protein